MLTRKQLEELLDATEELLSSLDTKPEPTDGCCCTPDESTCGSVGSDSESLVTPIEDCITTFLDKCTAEGRLPTLDEAKVIVVLDQIYSKYN